MASLLPNGQQQFLDANGSPLASGLVYFYVPGTTTEKDTYQDPGASILNVNPVELDASGEAIIYGTGSYRQVVYDAAGNLVWDQLTADTAVGGTGQGGTSTGSPNAQVIAASNFSQNNEQQIVFIVGSGLTNTGATTVAPGGGAGIPVLKDTASGPTALTGGEMVEGNAYLLTYDTIRGAFHVNATSQAVPTTFQDNQFRVFNAADNTKKLAFDASKITTGDTRTYIAPDADGTLLVDTLVSVFGGCQLQFNSSSTVKLVPFKGNLVSFPSAALAVIPSAGISSTVNSCYLNGTSGSSLTASTLYYAYLWNSGSAGSPAYVIDWSATGHATDTTSGIEIKSGDATRVLVGMAYPQSGPVFADTAKLRLVATWFNRRARQILNAFTTSRTTTSSSYTEINSEIRTLFLSWGDGLFATYSGSIGNPTNQTVGSGVSLDGAATAGVFYATSNTQSVGHADASTAGAFLPGEGEHYLTVLGKTAGGTATWMEGSGSEGEAQLSGVVTI